MKKVFTVSIGDYGTIIALHEEKNVKSKIFISSMGEENKKQIEEIFSKDKTIPVYILLDINDQVYTKKSYPLANKISLTPIIKKDQSKEYDSQKTILKNYYLTKNNAQNNWDCTFISINHSPELERWIEFLSSIDNRLLGIYCLPIEMIDFSKTIIEIIKAENKLKINQDTILFLIVQNKISGGLRQIAIKGDSIIFTRIINYNFDDEKFINQFQKDIFRTNEYLKMTFPKLQHWNFLIVNILPDKINGKLENIISKEFGFVAFSPSKLSKKLKINNSLSSDEAFSDVILANIFFNSKRKLLKFSDNKISRLEELYLAIKTVFFLNIFVVTLIIIFTCKVFYDHIKSNQEREKMIIEKSQFLSKIDQINSAASNSNSTKNPKNSEKIIDFGKITEALFIERKNISDIFNMIGLVKKYNALIDSFSYSILPESELNKATSSILINLSGDIYEKSGNIEQLIRNMDLMNLEFKKEFKDYDIKFSGIPKDINFVNKYYSLPINIEISYKEIKNR